MTTVRYRPSPGSKPKKNWSLNAQAPYDRLPSYLFYPYRDLFHVRPISSDPRPLLRPTRKSAHSFRKRRNRGLDVIVNRVTPLVFVTWFVILTTYTGFRRLESSSLTPPQDTYNFRRH